MMPMFPLCSLCGVSEDDAYEGKHARICHHCSIAAANYFAKNYHVKHLEIL